MNTHICITRFSNCQHLATLARPIYLSIYLSTYLSVRPSAYLSIIFLNHLNNLLTLHPKSSCVCPPRAKTSSPHSHSLNHHPSGNLILMPYYSICYSNFLQVPKVTFIDVSFL